MAQITLLSAPCWAVLPQQYPSWRGLSTGQSLFIIPAQLSSRLVAESFSDGIVLSVNELLQRYISKRFGQKHLLSRQSINYLLHTIIAKTVSEDQTAARYLNIETFYPGYVRALTEFILDFRENGPENLLETVSSDKKTELSARERDLVDIHDELENVLEQRGIFDQRRALLTFLKDKEQGKPEFFLPELASATLVIFGFNHFTRLESKLMGRLMFRFKQSIFAYCQNEKAAPITFRCQNSIETFISNVRVVFAERFQEMTLTGATESTHLPLAELMFADHKPVRLSTKNTSVHIYGANNRYAEVTYLARQIRHLQEQGIAFNDMQIILPAYETYCSLLTEIFPRYQIPFQTGSGLPLIFYPLARVISSLINHAITPNPFTLREHIFSSPYIAFNHSVSADALKQFVREIADPSLAGDSWIDSFLPHTQNFHLDFECILAWQRAAALAVRSEQNFSPLQRVIRYIQKIHASDPSRQQQKLFAALVQYYLLSQAERALYAWSAEMTPEAFASALEKLMRRFEIDKNINLAATGNDDIVPAIIAQDQQVLVQIRQILENMKRQYLALSVNGQKIPLTNLAQAFASLMADPEYYLPHSQILGIAVRTSLEPLIRFCPVTFMTGLVDGEFPAQTPFNFLQPKHEGRTLAGDLAWVDRDRMYFYQVIAATTRQLYLTYPVSDSDKKVLVSPFIAEAEKCFESSALVSSSESRRLYSLREKLVYISQHVDRDYPNVQPLLRELKTKNAKMFHQVTSIMQCDGLRNSVEKFSKFDGLIDSRPALDAISARLENHFIFNSDRLERFAGCPLRFLFDDLMGLKPEYVMDYHPDRTDRGLLIRNILTRYSLEAAKAGKVPTDAAEVLHAAATAAVAESFIEKDDLFSDRFKHTLLAGLKRTGDAIKKRPGLLAAFLEYELTGPDLLKPFLAALTFAPDDPGVEPFQIQDIPIEIRIENAMQTSNCRWVLIFNYSIADFGYVEGIAKGLRFQLPLQILALQKHLDWQSIQKTVAGAGVYLLKNFRTIKRGGYFALKELQATSEKKVTDQMPIFSGQRKYGFLPEANFKGTLQKVQNRIVHIHRLIKAGRFHLTLCASRDLICDNCHFGRICRIEQLRLDKIYTQVSDSEVYKPLRRIDNENS